MMRSYVVVDDEPKSRAGLLDDDGALAAVNRSSRISCKSNARNECVVVLSN